MHICNIVKTSRPKSRVLHGCIWWLNSNNQKPAGHNSCIELGMEWIGPAVVELSTVVPKIWMHDGNSHKGPMGQWPCCCTSTGPDGSKQFQIVTASLRIWLSNKNPARAQWANDLAVAHFRAKALPWDLICPKSVQRYWSCSICMNLGACWAIALHI